jgi:hypothetical protein
VALVGGTSGGAATGGIRATGSGSVTEAEGFVTILYLLLPRPAGGPLGGPCPLPPPRDG